MAFDIDCPVLVIGAGPVGLTFALDLAWRGIDVTVVEKRLAGAAPEPKCNHVSARSMEVFRRLGMAREIRDAGLPADFEHSVSYRTTFVGAELTRIHIPSRRNRYTDHSGPDGHWPTPEPPHRINQIYLEPILFRHAAENPRIRILSGYEATDIHISDLGAQVTLQSISGGNTLRAACRYLVGCDGARSAVRKVIGAVRELYADQGYNDAVITTQRQALPGGTKLLKLTPPATNGRIREPSGVPCSSTSPNPW